MKINDIILTEQIDQKEADMVYQSLIAAGDPYDKEVAKEFQSTRLDPRYTSIDAAQQAAETKARQKTKAKINKLKNAEAKNEIKKVSSYIFKQILILLHPFIPFVTEEIWLKNKFDSSGKDYLMLANWPIGEVKKDEHTLQVENIISIISELRSFKNELNVSPGSFIDVSIQNINTDQKAVSYTHLTLPTKA